MEKFFVATFFPLVPDEDDDSEFCYAERLSFCRQDHAELFREKISEKYSTHRVLVYAVDVTSSCDGDRIAQWLSRAIEEGEIQTISHTNPGEK